MDSKLSRSFFLLFGMAVSAHLALAANPILLVTSSGNPFTSYYAEILRTEGLNAFDSSDISLISASTLSSYDVVILGQIPLTAAQVTMFSSWVSGGGSLIAMRPDKQLISLLGLTDTSTTLTNGYLLVNTTSPPGAGIVGQTIQFHGSADQYIPNGATTIATLYTDSATATSYPAVTLQTSIGSGGSAAAFTYDLAQSVVYTHQGNPAWAGEARIGQGGPIRPPDLFYGAASFDPEPDWVDLTKVAIPQADEQQRLLANLILYMDQGRKPLPRFWYLPFGKQAAVVMTGDDHALGGTAGRFNDFLANSQANCSVANWECVRATSYAYVNNPLTNSQAAGYVAQGFEVAPHITTNCLDYTPSQLQADFSSQLSTFASQYPGIPAPATHRTHCVAWDDWSTEAQLELSYGIRFDTNYYYWPQSWIQNRPGMFTGSGIPMRFAQTDGTLIDIYQATTQMPDEAGEIFPGFINTLLDNAIGSPGYYGVFTANMHDDYNDCGAVCPDGHASEVWSEQIVASAQTRGVPVVSSLQMLQWLDGRNNSSFSSITWTGNVLAFTITTASGANGLQAMLPVVSSAGSLSGITLAAQPVSYSVQTVKGIAYAFFPAAAGAYSATYGGSAPPVISGVSASAATTTATISWATDQSSTSQVAYGLSPTTLTSNSSNGALTASHSIGLSGLAPGTVYYYQVNSANTAGGSTTAPAIFASPLTFSTADVTPPVISGVAVAPGAAATAIVTWTTDRPANSRVDFGVSATSLTQNVSDPTMLTAHQLLLTGLVTGSTYYLRVTSADAVGTTVTSPASPNPPVSFIQNSISVWTPSVEPTTFDSGDPASVEVGMKFRSDTAGVVSAVRFYKSGANSGTHIGNLWSSTGTLLGSVTFTTESAAGWQQANFTTPIAISANTTYVISYFAPGGHYSVTQGGFSAGGVDNPPLHALASGVDGPNGVYSYGSTSSFPTSSFNGNNYWVDLVFTDNIPPVISAVTATTTSTAATIAWTTNVAASSTVNYGTSPGALTASASNSSFGTSHSVTLTSLTAGTTYYYQIVSVDGFGNIGTAPASGNPPLSFVPAAAVSDSATSDFAAGSGTCSAVPLGGGGAVILPPAVDAEFNGTALPSGWLSNVWAAPGGFTFDGTEVNIDGADIATSALYGPGLSLEFTATFSGQAFQHVGFAADLNFDSPWILFSTSSTGNNLYARINGLPDVLIPGNWLGAPHLYRIDWTSTGITFSIDGTVVSTQTAAVTASLALIASDSTPGGGLVSVNWMRLSPYAASCSFLSRVLDAGTIVGWNSVSWLAATTPAESLAMSYRTGNTPSPDASWTSFVAVSASGSAITGTSRYIQYGAALSTTDTTRTPELESVTISYSTAVPPSITTQPAGATILSGQTASLAVVATGAPPLTYQWFTGSTGDTSQPISGATSSTYTTPALTATTSYWVSVSNSAGSTNSNTATITVNLAASTTSLAASPNPSLAGQAVMLTATVTAGATGSVTFLDGANSIGTATLSAGTATLSISTLAVGSHSLTATYGGDLHFSGSTSTAVTQVVNLITTKTVLTASANPIVSGQSVTLSAVVSAVAPGTGTPAGTVTFNDGATVLGTATLSAGTASLSVNTLMAGSHSLTAAYTANGNFAASTSAAAPETVNPAATTTSLASSAPTSAYGQSVTLTATVSPVSPGDGTVSGSVTFKDGTTVLGTSTLSGGSATLAVTSLAVGTHSLTAAFAGTSSYTASTSTTVKQVVTQSATTTVVNLSPATSVIGQSVTATVTVSPVAPGAGTPTGTATVLFQNIPIYSAPLSGGTLSTTISTIPIGTYTFTVSYGGDADFTASTSAATTVVVNPASTTTTLAAAPNPSVVGQTVTLAATVSVVSPGSGTATGTVTFKDGAATLGIVALNNGAATLSTSSLAIGSHSFTASYGGSSSFTASTSAVVSQTVTQISTTTALATSANPSVLGQSVTLSAAVSPVAPGTGTPTGSVTFKDGGTTLGTVTLSGGNANLVISNFALGVHSLTAVYGGSSNYATSTSTTVAQTVNPPSTTTTLTATPNPSTLGQSVTLKATVAVVAPGTGTPTGAVTFFDGSTSLGSVTLSNGSASLATSALPAGAHSLTAQYGGAANFAASTSAVLTQTVNLPGTTTVLTSNLNPSVYGQSTTLKAVVTPVSGSGVPTGTVTFQDGSTVIGTATLSGGAAITSTSTLTGGTHSLTAVYLGSTSYAGSTSAVVTQTVNHATTATGLGVSPLSSVYGQSVTLTATISSSSQNMSGTVTFKDGATTLGTGTVSSSTATLTVTTLSPAIHVLTATYNGDTNYSGSTSAPVLNLVSQANTTTAVAPSPNPSVVGQAVSLRATVSPVSPGSGTPTGGVSFKDGNTTLGSATLSGGIATLTVSSLAAGNHSITAAYNDDSNFNSSSSPVVTQVVNPASTSTTLTATPNPSNFGQSVSLKATVAALSPGGGTPTGNVVFTDGATNIGTVSLSGGTATLNISSLARGSHAITASYQGSSSYSGSTSAAVTQTVH